MLRAAGCLASLHSGLLRNPEPIQGFDDTIKNLHLKLMADFRVHVVGRKGSKGIGAHHMRKMGKARGYSAGRPVSGKPFHGVVPGAHYLGVIVEQKRALMLDDGLQANIGTSHDTRIRLVP